MQHFWQEKAIILHLQCLWAAGTRHGKVSFSWLTENVQCGISSRKQLKTRTPQTDCSGSSHKILFNAFSYSIHCIQL